MLLTLQFRDALRHPSRWPLFFHSAWMLYIRPPIETDYDPWGD